VTGFWVLDDPAGWSPPPGLQQFLQEGTAPVSVGFGSMSAADPAQAGRLAETVLEALRLTGRRAVLLTGWSGMPVRPSENVFALGEAPHGWLFPRVAAAVHHGGSGTTGASLRAGVPTVTVPFAFDQPFWGARVAAAGAGPPPIPRRRLTADRLARAIHLATNDPAMARRAADLGRRLRAEDGTGQAARILETYLQNLPEGTSP
jgi:sterol 3beta-glucosyltransferase